MTQRPPTLLQEHLAGQLIWSCPEARRLASGQSRFQHWEVWQTREFGKLYRLDGDTMASEADEFLCHEPLVHLAGLAHPGPHRALVLGGGDGASARELLRYPSLNEVIVVELDEAVVDMTKEFIPALSAGAFEDPRTRLVLGDAYDFVMDWTGAPFDLIVFDLTAPTGAAAPLFSQAFLHACQACLSETGALCLQWGSPVLQAAQCAQLYQQARACFARVCPFFPVIPVYGGRWAMAVVAHGLDPATLSLAAYADRASRLGALRALDAAQYFALQRCPPAWACLSPAG